MDLQLHDKVAVVTGSSRGLGLAIARALVQEGCLVTVCSRGAEALAAAADDLRGVAGIGDRVLAVQGDVSVASDAEHIVARTRDTFGGIDILVNNVGVARGSGIVDTPDEDWHFAFDQTVMPAVRMSRLVVPLMRARGAGAIVMVASIWGRESGGRMTYNAVKAAEISLAKAMAQQLARDNIRVNSLAPGSISFPGGSWHKRQVEDPEGMAEFVARELPFGRFGRADEVGAVAAFLCSPIASWVSGACLTVDGCQSRSNF